MAPADLSAARQEYLLPPLPSTERGKQTILDVDPANTKRVIYAHGKSIYRVDLEDPANNEAYTEHSHSCTVAKFSPSGYYVASGDVTGRVRVWDATQTTHILKAEYQVLGGPIRDISWDGESKHIIAVGEGREKFAHAFSMDTGSSLGEVIGQTKTLNSVSIRPCRPVRAATASDDFSVNFYCGTPYKFSKSLKHHKRFVQCVRYAPDGSKFATCGSDGKVFIFDGETGDFLSELQDPKVGESAHASGVLALCWSPDSQRLVSSSMDQLTKIWDVASESIVCESSVKFSQTVAQDNHVVGNLWTGMGVLILSLSGAYAVIDVADGHLLQMFEGHQKGYSTLLVTRAQEFVTASYDGNICKWDASYHASSLTKDKQVRPNNQVDDLLELEDKIVALTPLDSRGYALTASGQVQALGWLTGNKMASVGPYIVCLGEDRLCSFKNDQMTSDFASFPAKARTLSAHGNLLAVGLDNKSIVLFELAAGILCRLEGKDLTANFGVISALAFNEDGSKLAAGDDQRRIKIYDMMTFEPCKSNWCYHNAKVSCLTWLQGPMSGLLVSGSLDNSLMVWSLASPIKPLLSISNAHTGPIVSIVALADGRFASASQDGSVKVWRLVR